MIPSPQLQITNSSFIKSEIERFESVHPSIYSIYELIEELKDQSNIQAQVRDHVMVIEGKTSNDDLLFNQKRFVCFSSSKKILL